MKRQAENRKIGNKVKYAIIFVMAPVFFLLTGCAGSNPRANVQSGEAPIENQAASNRTAEGQNTQPGTDFVPNVGSQSDIGLEQAKNAALLHAGLEAADVTFTKERADYDDGIAEYEIEFVTATAKYEYEVKAADGTIMEAAQEPIEQIKGPVQTQGIITLDEAKTVALDYAGLSKEQVSYTKLELDYDDGVTEYEIEFYAGGREYSFTIEAASGKVLEMEMD